MTALSRRFSIALLSLSSGSIAFAQAPALDVRMGLWELSSTVTIGGESPFDTSKLSPEQKAQMDEAMKSARGGQTIVDKTCMTKEKFDKASFISDMPGMDCKQTISTNTRSTLEANVVCTGVNSTTMQMRFDAESPTSVKGSMKGTTIANGKTMTSAATMSGKWLGADCGSTK